MEGREERVPLPNEFGLLLIEDFCSSTGLDSRTVETLLRDGRIEGVVFDDRDPDEDQDENRDRARPGR